MYVYVYIYIYIDVCVCIYIYIYIDVCVYIYISSSCRAACADIPDRLSPFLPIIHRLRQVFRVASRVLT